MARKKKVAAPEQPEPKQKKPKTQELGLTGEGVEKKSYPELDSAVLSYVENRDKRIAAGVEEKKDKKLVLAIMDKNNIQKYEVDSYVVLKKPKDETESLKVVNKADYEGDPEDLE